MAAPTNAAYVKKALANSEPSTHGTKIVCRNLGRSCKSASRELARKGSPPPSLRLLRRSCHKNSNQIARGRIRRFKSYMPSQTVGLCERH